MARSWLRLPFGDVSLRSLVPHGFLEFCVFVSFLVVPGGARRGSSWAQLLSLWGVRARSCSSSRRRRAGSGWAPCAAGFLFCALRWGPRGTANSVCALHSVELCVPVLCRCALCARCVRCVGAACVLAGCVAVHLVRSRAFGSLRSLVPRGTASSVCSFGFAVRARLGLALLCR